MTRRFGILIALFSASLIVGLDWSLGVAPNPYRAPDPMAFGSQSGASGAICTFAPGANK
jgi:hypothetical protein